MDRWEHTSRLYHAVRNRAKEERAAFLSQECQGDDALRRDVESLLRRDNDTESFSTRQQSIIGRCFGPYEILSALGAGGMGEVYKAHDTRLKRPVAIKILSAAFSLVRDRRARFFREAQAIAALNHPHICIIHDVGHEDGIDYLVMEYLEGETLRERVAQGPLALDHARTIATDVCEALSQAHTHGVVHRDVKPGNIMLATNGTKLLDFGLAKVARDDDLTSTDFQTATGVVLGTAAYMSPEQLLGLTIDPRSDVFSLGVVLYEMVTGARPFRGANVIDTVDAILHKQPEPILEGSIPRELQQVISRCLEKERDQRYVSAQELLWALETLSASTAGSTVPRQLPRSERLPNNLPKDRTHFIGRETELDECGQLLSESRLLTVTGIGGSGKTRFAVRLAERLLQSYPDGVWFVDLSPLREAFRVAETIAVTLAIGEEPGKGLLETVVHHVRGKRLLLVLDNCEHLLDACGALVDALLRSAEDVRVLVTSRESLGIEGERFFALRSLAVPAGPKFNLDAVKASEAALLFVDRARIVDGAFVLDAQSALPVAEICRRLEGIPLAIELAAARVKMLSVEEIRSRLDDRFRLLTGGPKALPRHQTLRAAFQWSYDLLTANEQRLFRLLAVFAGGWTLEAATAVWSDAADEVTVLELMTCLADKSLVIVERLASGTSQYRMLEMSRQFALEKLNEAGEGDAVRARHLKYFVAWVEQWEARDEGDRAAAFGSFDWFRQVAHEYDNLILALESSVHAEDGAKDGLRLARHMSRYWWRCGMYTVGRERLGAALLSAAELATPERAAVLAAMGHMAWKQGALAESRACHEESLALSRKDDNARGVIAALDGLGFVHFDENDPAAAQICFEEALALARARERHLVGQCLNSLGFLSWERGDLPQARAHWEDSLGAMRALGNPWGIAVIVSNLTDVALRDGAWADVRTNLREALPIVRLGMRSSANQVLKQLASLAAAKDDAVRAARWFGAAAAVEQAVGSKRHFHRESYKFEARVREKLDAATFARAAAEGAALGYEEALAEAQAWLEDPQRWVHHN